MRRILFVCLGNICRSPLAEGLFLQKLVQRGITHLFDVDSAGTSDYHIGELPDPRTRKNAEQNGLALQSRARQFRTDDFMNFDLILVMDSYNWKEVTRQQSSLIENPAKVMLMRDFDRKNPGSSVPDPYQGGISGFQEVFDILDHCTDNLLEFLVDELNKA